MTGPEYIYYVAYGMNLDPSTMDWGHAEKVGKGTLHGWAWHLRVYADVQPEAGASCEVGVWKIDADCLRMLDGREGYRPADPESGMYNRATVTVQLEDGTEVEALVYYMTQRMLGGYGMERAAAGEGYVSLVRAGREFFGMDTSDLPVPRTTTTILYEFECCGPLHVEVDRYTYHPPNDLYVCPECGTEEAVPVAAEALRHHDHRPAA